MLLTRNKDLNYTISETYGGRWEFSMPIGPSCIRAVRIPAGEISAQEWNQIQNARLGYALMWGGGAEEQTVAEDPFDGRDPASPYQTFHFIGRLDIPGLPDRLITMRQVGVKPGCNNPAPPFDDAAFWLLQNRTTGEQIPLWEYLNTLVDHPSQLVAISRTGTHPWNAKSTTSLQLEKERNAIAFAAIQILATYRPSFQYMSNQLCHEFRTRVHTIEAQSGETICLDFAATEETLGLTDQYRAVLNVQHPGVRHVKAYYPGYWVDPADAKTVLNAAVAADHITLHQLEEIASTIQISARYRGQDAVTILTKPCYFKHLIPLFKKVPHLQESMVVDTAGRPYSSTLIPRKWGNSALRMLHFARENYLDLEMRELSMV
ncbi:MAG: hypothetical protein AAF633_02455 [Chloroflexota bacterium]